MRKKELKNENLNEEVLGQSEGKVQVLRYEVKKIKALNSAAVSLWYQVPSTKLERKIICGTWQKTRIEAVMEDMSSHGTDNARPTFCPDQGTGY